MIFIYLSIYFPSEQKKAQNFS